MRIIAVDPDPEELSRLSDSIREIYGGTSVESFSDPLAAVKFAYGSRVDAVYTVTNMKRLNGFEMGKLLRTRQPDIRLHFIADNESEKTDAMRLMAESCILRPVTANALRLAAKEE